jgi:hypothetical protein
VRAVRRLLAAGLSIAVVSLLTFLTPTAAQAAAQAAPAPATVHAISTQATTAHSGAPATVTPRIGACDPGWFCAYTSTGRTGHECAFLTNTPTLGACTNAEESVWNNGTACSGCDQIRMVWAKDYLGAFAPLSRGGYYDDLHHDYFWHCGTSGSGSDGNVDGCDGYSDTLWHNIASAYWA